MSTPTAPELSVVIPAWNEEAALPVTLENIMDALTSAELQELAEIIVVSDGSSDSTVRTVCAALEGIVDYTVVDIARNVGSHAAIRCGLSHASGSYIVILSADGQDPPETIAPMLEKLRAGSDIVWGQRSSRDNDPRMTRATAGVFYRTFRWLTSLEYPPSGLDFVAFTSQVKDAVALYTERNLPLFLLIYNLGFTQAVVPYDRGERTAGVSGWSFRKRMTLAVDMVTAVSATPMRLISLLGVIVAFLGFAFGLLTIIRAIATDLPVPGWSSLIVLTSVMSGTILLGIAALGEYMWRSLDETRRRPIYLERNVITSTGRNSEPQERPE